MIQSAALKADVSFILSAIYVLSCLMSNDSHKAVHVLQFLHKTHFQSSALYPYNAPSWVKITLITTIPISHNIDDNQPATLLALSFYNSKAAATQLLGLKCSTLSQWCKSFCGKHHHVHGCTMSCFVGVFLVLDKFDAD